MVSLSNYSTMVVGSQQHEGTSPSNNHHDNQQLPEEAYMMLNYPGQVGSLEDFQRFKNGHHISSSRLGSLEAIQNQPIEPLNRKFFENYTISANHGQTVQSNCQVNPGYRGQGYDQQVSTNNGRSKSQRRVQPTDIQITMLTGEQRFGFSVMGGCEEGFPPRIDEISRGSPAERANLEVGDEIVEVNGRTLENCTHAEVITYIHKCIRSRSICLRVKRQKGTKSVTTADQIQNAYIVAVEEDAKRRLEELVFQQKVVPVDVTENVTQPRPPPHPVIPTISGQIDQSLEERRLYPTQMPFNSKGQHYTNGNVEMTDMNGHMEQETPKKGKGKKDKRKTSSNTETPLIDAMLAQNRLGYDNKATSLNSLNKSKDTLYDHDSSLSDGHVHSSSIEFDENGPHREMAIDCPDEFVGSIKAAPKYPPPVSNHSSPRSTISTTPVKTDSAKNSLKPDRVNSPSSQISANQGPLNEEQMERLRKHQEELRKRREEEDRRAKEAEFLRASLRGSKKLQALEQRNMTEGIVNTAFLENDDVDNDMGGFEEGYVSGQQTTTGKELYMKKNVGLEELFHCVQHIRGRLKAAEGKEEISFLTNLFNNSQFQHAVKVHSKVLDVTTCSPPPKAVCTNSAQVVQEAADDLSSTQSTQATELVNILNKCNVKCLLQTHDDVAQQYSRAQSSGDPPSDDSMQYPLMQYGEDSVKIVHLEKTNEPLGATVKNEGEAVVIGRIVKGGTAEKSGLLHEGDEILEINSVDMKGKDINDVSEMLANMTGTITFMIIPNHSFQQPPSPRDDFTVNVRALFNYDPEDDLYIPCRELGVSFLKGDILHVINQEDPSWWQAYREGEQEHQTLAGLIPSKTFHEQREAMRRTYGGENKENQKKSRSCSCGRKGKKKKKLYKTGTEEPEEILSYEEVALYYPEPNRRRPIVLIGPPNVGRQELRRRLMESDFDRFAAAVPHTSRPIKAGEEDGKDYHFVSRAVFEADIVASKFVEHGEFEKNFYGTSVHAIRQVINKGKICVLNLDPEALHTLKQSDLKPYVMFVYPPNLEKLKQIQIKAGIHNVKDDALKDIIEKAREMEDKYGHFFDYILVNSDMDKAFDELLAEINRIEMEPQWVPSQWLT